MLSFRSICNMAWWPFWKISYSYFLFIILFCYLLICVCVYICKGQKHVLDLLELKLLVVWTARYGCWEWKPGLLEGQEDSWRAGSHLSSPIMNLPFTTNFIHLKKDSILKSQAFFIFRWKIAELLHLLARNHEKIPGAFWAFETGSGYLELHPLASVSWDGNYKCVLHQRGGYLHLLKESWPNKFILHLSLNISHRLCY